jgi:hypothetical protein
MCVRGVMSAAVVVVVGVCMCVCVGGGGGGAQNRMGEKNIAKRCVHDGRESVPAHACFRARWKRVQARKRRRVVRGRPRGGGCHWVGLCA